MLQTRPYGSWTSPITTDVIVAEGVRLGDVVVTDDPAVPIVGTEGRPGEGGRNTLVSRRGREPARDLLHVPLGARSRVHEYGGGAVVAADGRLYFTNFSDQQIHRIEPDGETTRLTHASGLRFADPTFDHRRRRLILVVENHRQLGEPKNGLATVDLARGGEPIVLESGKDFYAAPRVSPDGHRLAWVSWNHPNMPWDGSELWGRDDQVGWDVDRSHASRRRIRGVGRATGVVSGSATVLRVRPNRMVESVPLDPGTGRADDGCPG